MGLEETGVRLVAKDKEQFISAMSQSQKAVTSFGQTVQYIGGGGLTMMGLAGRAAAGMLGNLLAQAVINVTGRLEAAAKSTVLTASRFQEMDSVAKMLAARMGYGADAVDAMIKKIRSYGIEAETAADLVSQFVRYNLDLSKATDLARVAQDAAILTGENSSQTLQRLLWGVQTYNTEVLRTAGLNINMQQAFKKYADQLGTTAEALNAEQRSQAAMNAILEEGAKIAGSYDTAMGSAGKQLRSLPRLVNDLAIAVGTPLQDAFLTGITAVNNFVKTLATAFSPGGTLYPAIQALGTQVNNLITNLIDLGTYAGKASGILTEDFGKSMENLVNNAFTWGQNLISQLASGMLDAAIEVVNALTFIGDLITSLLQANSPPKLLPKLPDWGKSAMNEWLKGWQSGDFSIFGDIASTIERVIKAKSTAADDTGIIPKILGSREAIARALATVKESGVVSEETLTRLYKKTGATDQVTKDYLKSTLELAAANDKVKKAQEYLNQVTEKYAALIRPLQEKVQGAQNTQDTLSDQQRIWQMGLILQDVNATAFEKEQARAEIEKLRAGIQLRDISKQAQAEQEAAAKRVQEAQEEAARLAEEQAARKAMIDIQVEQNELTKQQIALLERLAKAQEAAAKGGGAGKGGAVNIGAAIAAAAQAAIRAATPKNFADLLGKLGLPNKEFGPKAPGPFEALKTKIDELTLSVNKMGDAWGPAGGKITGFFGSIDWGHLAKLITEVTAALVGYNVVAAIAAGTSNSLALGIGAVVIGLDALANPEKYTPITQWLDQNINTKVWAAKFDELWAGIWTSFTNSEFYKTLTTPPNLAERIWIWLTGGPDGWLAKVGTWLTQNVGDPIKNFFTGLSDALVGKSIIPEMMQDIYDSVTGKFLEIINWFPKQLETLKANVTTLFQGAVDSVKAKLDEIVGAGGSPGLIGTFLSNLVSKLTSNTLIQDLVNAGKSVIQGFWDGAKSKWDEFIGTITTWINNLPDIVKKALGIASPSTVFADIGRQIMAGLAQGLIKGFDMPEMVLKEMTANLVAAPQASGIVSMPAASNTYNYNYTLHMQTVQSPRAVQQSFEMMRLLGGG